MSIYIDLNQTEHANACLIEVGSFSIQSIIADIQVLGLQIHLLALVTIECLFISELTLEVGIFIKELKEIGRAYEVTPPLDIETIGRE